MFRLFTLSVTPKQLMLIGATGSHWPSSRLIGVCNRARESSRAMAIDFDPYQRSPRLMRDGRVKEHDSRQICIDHLREMSCSCGIWGYKEPRFLLRDNYFQAEEIYGIRVDGPFVERSGAADKITYPYTVCVGANVIPWGVVLEAEYGFRASAALIDSLMIIRPEPPAVVTFNLTPLKNGSTTECLWAAPGAEKPEAEIGALARELSDTYGVPVRVVSAFEFFTGG